MRNELHAGIFSPEVDEHVVYPLVVGFGERWRRCELHQTSSGQRSTRESDNAETERRPRTTLCFSLLLNEISRRKEADLLLTKKVAHL